LARFTIRRITAGFIALIGVLAVTFLIIQLAPIDPARMYAGPRATPRQLEAATQTLGLNDPMIVQLGKYIYNFFTGNWGRSLVSKDLVTTQIGKTLPYTLEIVCFALLIQVGVGVALGVVSAAHKDRWPDHFSRILAVGLISIPTFWLALGLQYVFTGQLHMLPLSGAFSYEVLLLHPVTEITGLPAIDTLLTGNFVAFADHMTHMVMPVITLACMGLGALQRLTRSTMVEVLSEDYIVAARSYGISESVVLWHRGLKNSMGPVATFTGIQVGYLLVNTFLIESIFSWPGVGNYIVTAVSSLDYPVVISVTAVSAVTYLIVNTIADFYVAAVDPRVRLG
jgi:peptide/nickel transport system permease protein